MAGQLYFLTDYTGFSIHVSRPKALAIIRSYGRPLRQGDGKRVLFVGEKLCGRTWTKFVICTRQRVVRDQVTRFSTLPAFA